MTLIVLRYYKLQPYGDKTLAAWVRTIMGLALFFHMVISFMMISNNQMFQCLQLGNFSFDQVQAELTAVVKAIPFIDIIFDTKRFEE